MAKLKEIIPFTYKKIEEGFTEEEIAKLVNAIRKDKEKGFVINLKGKLWDKIKTGKIKL